MAGGWRHAFVAITIITLAYIPGASHAAFGGFVPDADVPAEFSTEDLGGSPAAFSGSPTRGFSNCMLMEAGVFNVWWTLDRASSLAKFMLEAVTDDASPYLALGFQHPNSSTAPLMTGTTATVAGLVEGGAQGFAGDYYLEAKAVCTADGSGRLSGVCPVSRLGAAPGRVVLLGVAREARVLRVTYLLNLSQGSDGSLGPDLRAYIDQPLMAIYAIGPAMQDAGGPLPLKHTLSGGRRIVLGASPNASMCRSLQGHVGGGSSGVQAELPACGVSRFRNRSVAFEVCKVVFDGPDLQWTLQPNNLLQAAVSYDHDGWVGFGLNPRGERMVGASAIIAWRLPEAAPSGETAGVAQYFLGGKRSEDVVPGGELRVVAMEAEYDEGLLTMIFTLQLAVEDAWHTSVVWAYGDVQEDGGSLLEKHDYSAALRISFMRGRVMSLQAPTLREAHGFLQVLAWGCLFPLGAIAARYFKDHRPLWFLIHRGVQTAGYLLSLVGFAIGLQLQSNSSSMDPLQQLHFGVALVITGAATLQVLAWILRPAPEAAGRPAWNRYHWWVGRCCIVLGVVQLYFGLVLINATPVYYVVITLLLLVWLGAVVGLEARRIGRVQVTRVTLEDAGDVEDEEDSHKLLSELVALRRGKATDPRDEERERLVGSQRENG